MSESRDAPEESTSPSVIQVSHRRPLLSIQYLRAVAALSVVVFHAITDVTAEVSAGVKILASGVDIFFVISGFIMWTTTYGSGISPLGFLRRRVERIVPLYWGVTTVAVAASAAAPGVAGQTNLWHSVSSFLFLPSVNPDTGRLEPIVSPGWTLNYEMAFYALFACALAARPRARLSFLALALVSVSIAGGTVDPSTPIGAFYTNPIVLEFGFGLAIGALFTSRRALTRTPALMIALFGALGLVLAEVWLADTSRAFKFGLPCALIVGAAALYEARHEVSERRIPHLLGDASYSIYICHGMVLTASGKLLEQSGAPWWATSAVTTAAAVAVGLVVYRWLERPANEYLRRRRRGSAAAAGAVA